MRRRRATLAAALWVQGAMLAIWALPSAGHAATVVALTVLGAGCAWRQGANASLTAACLGGAGMALGTWLDWELHTPACLCCQFIAHQPPWAALRTLLLGWGGLLMALACWCGHALTSGAHRPAAGQHSGLIGAPNGSKSGAVLPRPSAAAPGRGVLRHVIAMAAGMAIAAWLSAMWIRHLPGWKLEAGHVAMVAGMLAGTWASDAAAALARRLALTLSAPKRPAHGSAAYK